MSNLNDSEKKGLVSLMERVKEGGIVVTVGDKCKKICVSSLESYLKQGRMHTSKDKEIKREEAEGCQRILTACARGLVNIFGIGKGGFNQAAQTVWDNMLGHFW